MGSDSIGPRLLLYEPLCHLFSLSISLQSLPADWKIHLITPIHKAGDRSLVSNYRPISLLCIISKVLERILYNRLIEFLSSSISSRQFGFLKNRSTIHQLLTFLNEVYGSSRSKSQLDVIYLDFKKAFDSVSHNELLVKLWSSGITGNLWLWFKAYLSNRSQCVTINSHSSSLLPVLSGVPQGSILGPLLFLIFINDLPTSINSSSILLFTDDAKSFRQISSHFDCSLLQDDLDRLHDWSHEWKLLFNIAKCIALQFSHGKPPVTPHPPYSLNSQAIDTSDHHRDLGIIISDDLSWSAHYDHMCAQAYQMLGLIRRTFGSVSIVSARKKLYVSLVRSQVTYCSVIWRPHLIRDISMLETIQRHATKFILSNYSSDYKSRLVSLHLLPLMMQLEIYDLFLFIKSLKYPSAAFPILDFVSFCSGSSRSASHHKLRLSPTIGLTNHQRHFYFYRLPRLWNCLPPVDLSMSVYSIKSFIIQFFWHRFLQSFDPCRPCSFHLVCPCSRCSSLPLPSNFN